MCRRRSLSWLHTAEGVPVLLRLSRLGESQADFGLNDTQWRAQLVGGVGGGLGLAAPRQLDRFRRLDPDEQRPEENGDQQHGASDYFQRDQIVYHVIGFSEALTCDNPLASDEPRLQPERRRTECGH